jgi:hypothetical protein
VAAEWIETGERRGLDRRRRRYAIGLLARALVTEAAWTSAIPAAKIAGEQRRVSIRRQLAKERRSLASSTLRGRAERSTD